MLRLLRALWFLFWLAVFVGAAVFLADNPGDLSLSWMGYRVETSVAVLLLAVFMLLVAFVLLNKLWGSVFGLPRALSRYNDHRRVEKGYKAITSGLVAIAAGDAAAATYQAKQADKYLPEPPLARLLNAQAALLRGDDELARETFSRMAEDRDSAMLGLRGLAGDALHRGDREKALEYVRRAEALYPRQEWVVRSLFDLETRTGQWRDAMNTLKKAGRLGFFDKEQRSRHQVALWLAVSMDAEAAGDKDTALTMAKKAFRADPSFVPAAVRLARLHKDTGSDRAARKVVEKAWGANPHPDLARLWGDVAPQGKDALDCVRWFERLVRANPEGAAGHARAAEAALDAKLWGEARRHLDTAMELNPTSDTFRLMARLVEAETGSPEKGRKWLEEAALAAPDEAWLCTACHSRHGCWQPVCTDCGKFNAIDWLMPESLPEFNPAVTAHHDDFPALSLYGQSE